MNRAFRVQPISPSPAPETPQEKRLRLFSRQEALLALVANPSPETAGELALKSREPLHRAILRGSLVVLEIRGSSLIGYSVNSWQTLTAELGRLAQADRPDCELCRRRDTALRRASQGWRCVEGCQQPSPGLLV